MTFSERATALLQDAAAGALDRGEAHALARDWLDAMGGNVALSVLTANEHEATRIVELCELVLSIADAAEPEEDLLLSTNVSR